MTLNIFAIGASRNIGYLSSLQFLKLGHHVTFLLRNPSVFDNDAGIKPFIDSGAAVLATGDALVEDDLKRAWSTATSAGPVDLVLFTIGKLVVYFPVILILLT